MSPQSPQWFLLHYGAAQRCFQLLAFSYLVGCSAIVHAAEIKSEPLWPGNVPGESAMLPPEADQTKPTDDLIAGSRIIKLGNVSTPTLTVYSPDPAIATGAAVMVCPGGGYNILAMDLEGTEVCEWLNSIGVTAVLLKYRVPAREGRPRHAAALQDAQRALGLVRSRAEELGIDPRRIGVLGFSAGGHLAAMLSNHFDPRTYPVVDAADAISCRPDFAVLLYPGYLVAEKRSIQLSPDFRLKDGITPPTFLAMTQDDRVGVENVLAYYGALKDANIPAELHLYPSGGHGYGLRRTNDTVTTWPERVADWMKASGWLNAAGTKSSNVR
jgi:acetyl esterase/lipase